MHEKFAERQKRLMGDRPFRVPGKFIRPDTSAVTRINTLPPLDEIRRMTPDQQQRLFTQYTLRNLRAKIQSEDLPYIIPLQPWEKGAGR